MAKIVISIISHDDGRSIYEMIRNSNQRYFSDDYEIIIRENKISHNKYLIKLSSLYKNIIIKYNKNQYGFGRNHNLNFKLIKKDTLWFIVSNPDLVSLPENLNLSFEDKNIKLISPLILNNKNQKTDFMRLDINIFILFLRFFGLNNIGITKIKERVVWVPSVFKIFDVNLYKKLNGYDERIFMYCEDYDICLRAKKYVNIFIDDNISVVHKYTRESRQKFDLFLMHFISIIKVLFWKYTGKYSFKKNYF